MNQVMVMRARRQFWDITENLLPHGMVSDEVLGELKDSYTVRELQVETARDACPRCGLRQNRGLRIRFRVVLAGYLVFLVSGIALGLFLGRAFGWL